MAVQPDVAAAVSIKDAVTIGGASVPRDGTDGEAGTWNAPSRPSDAASSGAVDKRYGSRSPIARGIARR